MHSISKGKFSMTVFPHNLAFEETRLALTKAGVSPFAL